MSTGGVAGLRLGPLSIAWRLSATAAALVLLAIGQLTDTNDLFPFGSLSQYATARDPNGTVRSAYLLADTDNSSSTGEQVRVPLDPRGVGVGRAEIENQLDRILAEPSLLQAIADAHAGLHPQEPRYRVLYLMRDTSQLEDGRPTGERSTEELTRWIVREGGS